MQSILLVFVGLRIILSILRRGAFGGYLDLPVTVSAATAKTIPTQIVYNNLKMVVRHNPARMSSSLAVTSHWLGPRSTSTIRGQRLAEAAPGCKYAINPWEQDWKAASGAPVL